MSASSGGDMRVRVRALIDRHRRDRGPLLPVLHEVQSEFGCIATDAVKVVAEELNLSPAEVHGVVSFYGDFRQERAGRTVVRVCRGEACQAVGGEEMFALAQDRLGIAAGGTTPDGRATLDEVFCFGNCALGPTVEVDGVLHGRASAAGFERLLAPERPGGAACVSPSSCPGTVPPDRSVPRRCTGRSRPRPNARGDRYGSCAPGRGGCTGSSR